MHMQHKDNTSYIVRLSSNGQLGDGPPSGFANVGNIVRCGAGQGGPDPPASHWTTHEICTKSLSFSLGEGLEGEVVRRMDNSL